jgi:opacity protein-like surface antigen
MRTTERSCKPGLAGILLLALSCSPAMSEDGGGGTPGRGTYVSLFGGGGGGNSNVTQTGTALFPLQVGGPLDVNATGRTNTSGVGLIGLQIGHEWSTGSQLMPAFEIEGFYLRETQRARLENPTNRLPEHTFDNTFPMNNAVFLANAVLSFRTSYRGVTPYVGGGIGAARISVNGADSAQISPPEAGINHFNSRPDSSGWGFAAQAKAGVRVALGDRAYIFGEYRYLFVDSTDLTFGATVYPTHVPTTDWTVRFSDMSHHLGAAGIGFNF